ncbi:prion-inhibition and propagation-domain-containing protein [Xylaria arbuscula]|nr:prion-inhibition and propagation-domain-containing protein [Xylaria arbuscula]
MAEAVGTVASVVTLIGLLKGCIDACELIRAAKYYKKELEKYDLKVALEQCRLKTWGKSMGLIRDEDAQQGRHLLDGFEFRHVVEEALQQIINLLTNSDRLSKKYGAQRVSTELAISPNPDAWRSTSTLKLTMAFRRLRIHNSIRDQADKAMKSSVWVFYDQKKYASLIEELRTLVDAVENVTRDLVTREQQQQLFISRINTISDVRTLNMLTEVCEIDHPTFSDAASIRAEVISLTTTRKADVNDWIDNATSDLNESQEEVTDDMENWDLADFRRQYLALLNVQVVRSRTEPGMGDFSKVGGGSRGDDNGRRENEDEEHVEKFSEETGKDTSSTRIFSENDLEPGGSVDFNYAIYYINKFKRRFSGQLKVYKKFIEILRMYQLESMPIRSVYIEVKELLGPETDLFEEFKVLLPESMNRAEKHAEPPKFMAVNTMVPETAPLSEIATGLDMKDAETLRYYSELSMYKYGTRRDALAFSPHLGPESRARVADIAERFGLSHDIIILGRNTVQLIVRRPHQESDGNHDSDNANANANNDDDKEGEEEEDSDRVIKFTIEEIMDMVEF